MQRELYRHTSFASIAAGGRRVLACLVALAAAAAFATRDAGAQGDKMIALREASEGVFYSAQIAPPLPTGATYTTRTVVEGMLPPGLSVTDAGKLEGTPTPMAPRATPYQFKVHFVPSTGTPRMVWVSLEVREFVPTGARLVPAPTATPTPTATPLPTPYLITTTTNDEETIALTENYSETPPDLVPKEYQNATAIETLIGNTIGTSTRNFQAGDYCVVDIITWGPFVENKAERLREPRALFKAVAAGPDNVRWIPQQDPQNENVFATRIFGSKRVAVLAIHLNTPATWDVKYLVSITKKVPTPIQNALDLAAAISTGGAEREQKPKHIWGARMMLTKYESSEIVVKLNTVTANPSGRPVEQSKEHTKTYINERKYHWNVSVGLPIKNVREVRYKAETGRVTAEAKDRQSVYGFFNFHPWAVDLKGESGSFFTPPHLVFGVPLASKPLHHPFAGVGTGVYKTPIKFNLFAGIVFNRERVPRTLAEGAAATTGQLEADLRTRWVRKFMFGINLPVSQIKDAIKAK